MFYLGSLFGVEIIFNYELEQCEKDLVFGGFERKHLDII